MKKISCSPCSCIHRNITLRHTAVRAIPTTDPTSLWCTVTVSIICMASNSFQCMETLMSWQWSSLPSTLCPSLASAGHFSATRVRGRQHQAADLPLCCPCPTWSSPWHQAFFRKTSSVLQQARNPPSIFAVISTACLWLTNFFMLANLKNELAEAIGEKQKHLVFYLKSLEMCHMIPIKFIIPGLFDGQGFSPSATSYPSTDRIQPSLASTDTILLRSPPCPQSRPWVH